MVRVIRKGLGFYPLLQVAKGYGAAINGNKGSTNSLFSFQLHWVAFWSANCGN